MYNHQTAVTTCAVVFLCGFIGCNSVLSPGGQAADEAAERGSYLAVSISDFGGASALAVRDDAVTFKSTGLLLPGDLLDGAPDEVSAVVGAPYVAVTPDGEKGVVSSMRTSEERHAAVTFRLAPEDSDACVSNIVIGPFGLIAADNAITIASESLRLTEAARAIVFAGRFEICAQTLADFDGSLAINKLSLQFGTLKSDEDGVELCHIPPGEPENRHTITVGSPAVDAHLAHGDYLGPCLEAVEDLVLTSMCSDDPDVRRQWQIRNPNNLDIGVSWEVLAEDQSGTVVAPPGDSFFFTDTVEGANTTAISWLDENGEEHDDTKASGGAHCNPDTDGDGVMDDVDTCPNTPAGEVAGALGCSCSQRDGDADGVNDCNDNCPDTDGTEVLDVNGCSCSQRDSDLDGVSDCEDQCPFTPTTEQPDESGCSCSQRDGDADGVNDCNDDCPDTTDPSEVGTNGCPDILLDDDDDGVMDDDDTCPDTPVGEPVDELGCSCSQLDEDNDGVNDCDDLCPNTPVGAAVDVNGCGVITADAGPDVTLDELGCITLRGSASGGTEPYTYSWSAPGWEGSMEQNPVVVPFEATTYTLTVTDWSSPPQVSVDTMTLTFSSKDDLQYTIVNLGSPEGNGSYASGINDAGDVVGYYYTAAWEKRAFLYSGDVMIELGSLG
ncbi:MAG: thrombospondin type 3 repeat-containing protein, partial [Planctomycetota bacterium]